MQGCRWVYIFKVYTTHDYIYLHLYFAVYIYFKSPHEFHLLSICAVSHKIYVHFRKVNIPFSTAELASLVNDVLNVDKELKGSGVHRQISVNETNILM